MKTLPDLIKLCADEEGKVLIMDEQGEVRLVVMGVGEYQKLKTQHASPVVIDPEKVNQEIVQAQLAEEIDAQDAQGTPMQRLANPYRSTPPPQVSSNGAAKRDMREEVIDPSFDFDAPEDV